METRVMETVVKVDNLRKTYGSTVAVQDVSFEVGKGEIFGMVGPNGAGKTTTIECLEGQRAPDGGQVRVLGLDPRRERRALCARIGVQLQESNLPQRIKVWEALDLFASFYPRAADWRSLVGEVGLDEKRNAIFSQLSGGQKQRLFVVLALVHGPELVFLDELTTGLDPQARRAIWDLVRRIRDQGKTVFMTTHFMEEAEKLCDRVAILDHGQIIALDSPAQLIRNLAADSRVVFETEEPLDASFLKDLGTRVECDGNRAVVHGPGDRIVGAVVRALEAHGCRFRDLHTEQPNLEDVFLALTGQQVRD
jgi:ABC-2 type transport system ATP-binding protein